MFELDKEKFGVFVCELRKEKKLTQKELAEKLHVSDKAVSKWERGISMPDISLIVPMAELLGVTVTELLEGKRIEQTEQMSTNEVEALVKKAINLSEDESPLYREKKRKRGLIVLGAIVVAVLECIVLGVLGFSSEKILIGIGLGEMLGIPFALCFGCVLREKLPRYYDENKISVVSQYAFNLSLPGMYFNNRNWPHILKVGYLWSLTEILFTPLLYMVLGMSGVKNAEFICMGICGYGILGMFIPMYYVGNKYSK